MTTNIAPMTRLGFGLTIVLFVFYFGFISLCALAPSLLGRPVFAGGTVNWAFVYGLSVMVLGVALTGIYVLKANQADTCRKGH